MSVKWQTHTERGNAFSLWLICFIANHLGRRVARTLLFPITLYYVCTASEHCKASRNYLRRILEREPTWLDVAKHIHCFASTIVDRIYFVTDRVEEFDIEFIGEDLLDKLKDKQVGCLMLGAHVGSFEALRALGLRHQNLPLKVLMYPSQNVLITRLISKLNPQVAGAVIPLGNIDTLVRTKDAIGKGSMIGILGDRVAENEKQCEFVFLNNAASFPLGPALIADILDTPVFLCLALYLGGNKYKFILEELPPIEKGSRADREARVSRWTKIYVDRLELHLRSAPYNWFNFYEFWHGGKV